MGIDYLKEFGDFLRDDKTEMEYAFILIKMKDGKYQHSIPWTKLTTANT